MTKYNLEILHIYFLAGFVAENIFYKKKKENVSIYNKMGALIK